MTMKEAFERMHYALPEGWYFEETEDGNVLSLMVGKTCYAYYNDAERMLSIHAVNRGVWATFYVRSNEVKRHDVKRQIMRFIDAEGSLDKGIHRGFTLMEYHMSPAELEATMEDDAEYIRPTAVGQEYAWWARPDGITYLEDAEGNVVTAYDRKLGTYTEPYTNEVKQIPAIKAITKSEGAFREALEKHAWNATIRKERSVI